MFTARLNSFTTRDTGPNPDGILYVPGVQEVYTFNRDKNAPSATVIDAKAGKVITTIPLPGTPEFAVADIKAGRIYNNIDSKNLVVAIDIKTHEIVAQWPTAPGEGGSGMAIDLQNHRLFIGCDNLMVMMDSVSGKVVGTVPIGAGVDANRFDPGTKLAFASCGGSGSVTVAKEESPDKLTVVQTLGICLALWSLRCPLQAKSCHGFHGFYEDTTKRRCFLQPPGCRQRRRHHLVRLDTRMPMHMNS